MKFGNLKSHYNGGSFMSEHILGVDVGGSRLRLILTNKEAVIIADKLIFLEDGIRDSTR